MADLQKMYEHELNMNEKLHNLLAKNEGIINMQKKRIAELEEDEYRISNIIFEQNSKLKLANSAIKVIEKEAKQYLKRIERIKNIIGDDFTKLGGTDPNQRLERAHEQRVKLNELKERESFKTY